MSYVYLIHFSLPLGNPLSSHGTAQHYLGYTSKRVRERLIDHVLGRGAKITRAASLSGIALTVVRTWRPGTRSLERSLKNQKHQIDFVLSVLQKSSRIGDLGV
jgi:putative endonuclease